MNNRLARIKEDIEHASKTVRPQISGGPARRLQFVEENHINNFVVEGAQKLQETDEGPCAVDLYLLLRELLHALLCVM